MFGKEDNDFYYPIAGKIFTLLNDPNEFDECLRCISYDDYYPTFQNYTFLKKRTKCFVLQIKRIWKKRIWKT